MNLEESPQLAANLCLESHQRLMETVTAISDTQMRSRSRLAGWTIGHVVTHLARNADAHARRLEGALAGEDRPKYAGGPAQRAAEIDHGAGRPATEIIGDLQLSQARLETLFADCAAAGWPDPPVTGESSYGPRGCPAHRLRESEMHHVDLGLGYSPADWPDEYVAWDLPVLLSTVDERLRSPGQRKAVLAWLAGRGSLPAEASLTPWG